MTSKWSKVEVQSPAGSIGAFVELTLCARDVDESRVFERHVFKNDLQMTEHEIVELFEAMPNKNLNPDLYGLPSISAYSDDDDEYCSVLDIVRVVLTMQPDSGWDGEDVLSSILKAPWKIGNSNSAGLLPGF